MRNRLAILSVLLFAGNVFFTTAYSQIKKSYEFDFKEDILWLTNKEFKIFVSTKKGVYTLNNVQVLKTKNRPSIKLSPLGRELFSVGSFKISSFQVSDELNLINEINTDLNYQLKKIISDKYGRNYFLLSDSGEIFTHKVGNEISNGERIYDSGIVDFSWSANLDQVFAVSNQELLAIRDNKVQKSFKVSNPISSVHTFESLFKVAIGHEDGSISLVDQNMEGEINEYKVSDSKITSIVSHPEDPHLFIGNSKGELYTFNTISKKILPLGKIHKADLKLAIIATYKYGDEKEFLISYGEDSKITIWDITQFDPDFKLYVDKRIDQIKNKFFKRQKNEDEISYSKRTSIDISSNYFNKSKQNIIDSIAGTKRRGQTKISMANDGSVKVKVDPFREVIVNVASNLNPSLLGVKELNYNINEINSFDISNVLLVNKENGQSYGYNPERDKRIIREEQESILLAQEISRQEVVLKNNLTEIVASLKEDGIINEVDLSVDSRLVKEKDSTGKEELNLKVSFLSKGVTAVIGAQTSDYGAGKYNLFDSPSAKTLMDFFIKSTEENLSGYLEEATRVTFKITGSTDKSRVNSNLPYDGEFGDFRNFPYYFQGSLDGITINKQKGIASNSELGFLRTYSVREFIENYTDVFDSTRNKYIHYSEESNLYGADQRKIKIELTIHEIDKLIALKKSADYKLSDVDTEIPSSSKKINGYALIIGNEDYSSYQSNVSTSQNVPFASRDAESFKNYLVQMYGLPEENIILLINGTYGEISQNLSKFKNLMKFDGENKQFIFYFSGHGMPHETTNNPYLMPVDISGYTVDQAISLNDLLKDFSIHDYKKCTLVIDACFSGASRSPEPLINLKGVGKWRIKKKPQEGSKKSYIDFDFLRSDNQIDYMNPNIGDKMILYSSSSGEETSLTDDKNQHGLFTYHFLKILKDNKGDISSKELFDLVRDRVGKKSILDFNKPQTPEIIFGDKINFNSDYFLK